MPFQSVPDCAELVIKGTDSGKEIVNVLHFRHAGGYAQGEIEDLATIAGVTLSTTLASLVSANITLDSVTARGLADENDFSFTDTSIAGPGTAGGSPLPANNSLVTTLRSAFTGRSARGRIYNFATGTNNIQATGGNLYTSGYATAVAAMWQQLRIDEAVIDWTMVIVSRWNNKVLRPTGVAFTVLSIENRNLLADSQRGRLPKGH